MSSAPSPQTPPYRITLFYGPEPSEAVGRIHCVFNVKKRSWKAGVQVVVELEETQLAGIQRAIDLEGWEKDALATLPEIERHDASSRIPDLFAQVVCAIKLELAIEAGLAQENVTIDATRFGPDVDETVLKEKPRIIEYLRTELDLPAS